MFREPGVELARGVHAIGPSKNGHAQGGYSRAYLFEEPGGFTLVDTLWDRDAHMILRYLSSIGKAPSDIRNIAISHAHRSHLGGVATLRALSGATVHSHAWEAPIIAGETPAAKIPLWPLTPLELIPFRIASQLGLQPHDACEVDAPNLQDGCRIGELEVLYLPGHTPGNLGFLWEKDGTRVVAVADTIMTWPRELCAGWPGFNADEQRFRRSLRRVVGLKPHIVGTGHGDPICDRATERIVALLD